VADYVAPVLTIPQGRALLSAISTRVAAIDRLLFLGPEISLPGIERRALAAEARSLFRAADAIRRTLPDSDPAVPGTPPSNEGTP
jgi:hypothetical protein